ESASELPATFRDETTLSEIAVVPFRRSRTSALAALALGAAAAFLLGRAAGDAVARAQNALFAGDQAAIAPLAREKVADVPRSRGELSASAAEAQP
ncbi:MAG TPA: hypothetical protein VLT33_41730, partial [Labilithrix sp.]|nr:hypothetical protein [Labilithrix sp.]